jgi:flavin reductase (DIM6/NTAB) family NADH-FMN oxidoreductase RutF
VPPLVLWDGIAVRENDPRLLEDAVGWLLVRTIQEVDAGDHVFFIGEVQSIDRGPGKGSLVYLDRAYTGL